MKAKVVALAGDGIGPEVMESGLEVLRCVVKGAGLDLEVQRGHIGGDALDRFALPLDDHTLAACKAAHAVLLGAGACLGRPGRASQARSRTA